jgi:AcrR family transcriptional regulator
MATENPVAGEPPTPHRGPGRPRDASRDQAILTATFALLRQRGYPGLTIEAVAAEAGVGRPTIYRRWPSKPALVVAALMDSSRIALPAPDTGSLRDDLIAVQRHQVSLMNSPESRRVTAGLLADLATDEELAERYVTEYLMPRRASVFQVLQRGVDRGELTPEVDFAFVYDLLVGPLFMRAVVWGQPLGPEAAADTAGVVLARYGAERGTGG